MTSPRPITADPRSQVAQGNPGLRLGHSESAASLDQDWRLGLASRWAWRLRLPARRRTAPSRRSRSMTGRSGSAARRRTPQCPQGLPQRHARRRSGPAGRRRKGPSSTGSIRWRRSRWSRSSATRPTTSTSTSASRREPPRLLAQGDRAERRAPVVQVRTSSRPAPAGITPGNLPDDHWFTRLRQVGSALFLKNETRVERFLAYDTEVKIPIPVKIRGGPDEYTLQNLTAAEPRRRRGDRPGRRGRLPGRLARHPPHRRPQGDGAEEQAKTKAKDEEKQGQGQAREQGQGRRGRLRGRRRRSQGEGRRRTRRRRTSPSRSRPRPTPTSAPGSTRR